MKGSLGTAKFLGYFWGAKYDFFSWKMGFDACRNPTKFRIHLLPLILFVEKDPLG